MSGLIDPVAAVAAGIKLGLCSRALPPVRSIHTAIRHKTISNLKAGRRRYYIPPVLSSYEPPERPMLKSKWLLIYSPA